MDNDEMKELKMWPMFFDQLLAGGKPWEFRSRGAYYPGQWIRYIEWCPLRHALTGRTQRVIVLQTVDDGEWCAFRQELLEKYLADHKEPSNG